MRNNLLYGVVGALTVLTVVLGYQLYQDRHHTTGFDLSVGPNGVALEKK